MALNIQVLFQISLTFWISQSKKKTNLLVNKKSEYLLYLPVNTKVFGAGNIRHILRRKKCVLPVYLFVSFTQQQFGDIVPIYLIL